MPEKAKNLGKRRGHRTCSMSAHRLLALSGSKLLSPEAWQSLTACVGYVVYLERVRKWDFVNQKMEQMK